MRDRSSCQSPRPLRRSRSAEASESALPFSLPSRTREPTDITHNVVSPHNVQPQLILPHALVHAVDALDRVRKDDVGRLVEPLELSDDCPAVLGDDEDLFCDNE